MPGRIRLSMKWLDARLSAVMVRLTLLVLEEAAMQEYPMSCGGVVHVESKLEFPSMWSKLPL